MPRITDILRARLLAKVPTRVPDLPALLKSERDRQFDRLRMNRKVLGAMRYGLMRAEGKPQYDRVADMIKRLRLYAKDRNAEHLVDVANLAELEFAEGEHNNWKPSDDGEHVARRE
jgi:hypothetical protein